MGGTVIVGLKEFQLMSEELTDELKHKLETRVSKLDYEQCRMEMQQLKNKPKKSETQMWLHHELEKRECQYIKDLKHKISRMSRDKCSRILNNYLIQNKTNPTFCNSLTIKMLKQRME